MYAVFLVWSQGFTFRICILIPTTKINLADDTQRISYAPIAKLGSEPRICETVYANFGD